MNVNPRRVAVAAWRLPRASLGDTRGDTPGESSSARLTSLSNGHGRSHANTAKPPQTPVSEDRRSVCTGFQFKTSEKENTPGQN